MARKKIEFIDNSKEVIATMESVNLKWLEMAAIIVESHAVAIVAVDNGRLRDSIDYRINKAEMEAYVGTPVEYAVYVEFGTGEFAENGNGRQGGWAYPAPDGSGFIFTFGMKPQPFLRPAFRNNAKRIQKLLADLYKEAMG
ncbi:MAG: HK97 gp10 family phage protein [Turicibacter sp.]|nr:HK97 gp10 family phage protein [Turicibacter sp.]